MGLAPLIRDTGIFEHHPDLNMTDLEAAWAYERCIVAQTNLGEDFSSAIKPTTYVKFAGCTI